MAAGNTQVDVSQEGPRPGVTSHFLDEGMEEGLEEAN